MYLIYNSVVSPESDFSINVDNRSFQYGDGLFETLRYQNSRIAFWSDHYDRLMRGMTALQIDPPDGFSADALHGQFVALLVRNNLIHRMARLKIQVWRQAGGLYTPTNSGAAVLITARTGQPFIVGGKSRLGIFGDVRLSQSTISAYKTANALPYVLAGLARQSGGFDDMILLDTHGHVAEGIASALFWLRNQTLFMPSLETGCIDGILRRQLTRLAPDAGFGVEEGLFFPGELARADAIFCGNVMGIQRFGGVNGAVVSEAGKLDAAVEERLSKLFAQLV